MAYFGLWFWRSKAERLAVVMGDRVLLVSLPPPVQSPCSMVVTLTNPDLPLPTFPLLNTAVTFHPPNALLWGLYPKRGQNILASVPTTLKSGKLGRVVYLVSIFLSTQHNHLINSMITAKVILTLFLPCFLSVLSAISFVLCPIKSIFLLCYNLSSVLSPFHTLLCLMIITILMRKSHYLSH